MYQFCYASESTSEKQHLFEDLTAILSEARNFNYKLSLKSKHVFFSELV